MTNPPIRLPFDGHEYTVGFGAYGVWALTVMLNAQSQRIYWAYDTVGSEGVMGSGIIWRNGRLTAHATGPASQRDRVSFKRLIDHCGLSFGAIEAELREMTGYQEEDA